MQAAFINASSMNDFEFSMKTHLKILLTVGITRFFNKEKK